MTRPALQAILSLTLCPLLTAQEVAIPASPQPLITRAIHTSPDFVKGRKIQLIAQDPVSIDAAQRGALFHFVVDKDVAIDGTTVIHAGTPVSGVVAKVNHGSYERSRAGYIDIRLIQQGSDAPTSVRLDGIAPEPVYRLDGSSGGFRPSLVPLVVLGIFALGIAVCAARNTCNM